MNSTAAVGVPRSVARWLVSGWLAILLALPALGAENPIPKPPGLQRDVDFWIRVYTEINTNSGFLHDERNLAVVYETLRFAPNTGPREREKIVERARDKYAAALKRIASASSPLSAEDQRIKDLWGAEGTPARLREAASGIRFQLGQADRFLEGLVRAGAWQAHIAEVFANQGLPHELAVLPHVESSFNPAAYSKVGAAGLWQFMRSTGRRYMRIDSTVDDRLDPFRSTEAAAQLLSYNYRLLGTWPLALTAYNHGAAGMRRARDSLGTDDIEKIVRTYKSPTFGFASRNFYVSFLAALEIDSNPDKYFPAFKPMPELKFREVTVPSFAPIAAIQRAVKVSMDELRELNPALRPLVWNGTRHVPKGYKLRLPYDGEAWTSEMLAARLAPSDQFAGQPEERTYRVRRGDTLSGVAAKYGVTTAALAEMNGMRTSSSLRVGRTLLVPPGASITVAAAQASGAAAAKPPEAAPIEASATTTYIVRRGDSLEEIAKRSGLAQSTILKLNGLKDPDYIYEGQKLLLASVPPQPGSATPPAPSAAPPAMAAAPPATAGAPSSRSPSPAPAPARPTATPTKPVVVASTTPDGAVPASEAQRESDEDVEAVEKAGKTVARAEPVSAAQAEALGPALGPAIETPQTADPIDYSVGADNTIVVVAEETLGHYADWLGVTAQRLRNINRMKFGRPVIVGRKLKLDFSRVKPEQFEAKRKQYHRTLQATYFAEHRILGTEIYIVRRGDSLWTVTQRYDRLPMWLLQQYNPDVDFSEMRAGTEIIVPKVEEVAQNG